MAIWDDAKRMLDTRGGKANASLVRALRNLDDMDQLVVRGEVWTKFEELGQYRVAPHGEEGDYDSEVYFVDFEDLAAHFGE